MHLIAYPKYPKLKVYQDRLTDINIMGIMNNGNLTDILEFICNT